MKFPRRAPLFTIDFTTIEFCHLNVKVNGSKAGNSAVATATYRSAARMRDESIDRVQDFSNKHGVVYSNVMLPENTPEQWSDLERLWNYIETFAARKDA
ncbi:MAG: MobA/MobL family protein [Asticcacaulis sp.]